jgi:GH25 family lysozyme M1 (1,4-beta-N-acetylmuramidase)
VAVDLIDSAVKEAIMLDKAVVDLSHWDEVDSFDDAKVDGVVGIIHKATESNNYFDPTYNQRKKDALAAGLALGRISLPAARQHERSGAVFCQQSRKESRSLRRRSRR